MRRQDQAGTALPKVPQSRQGGLETGVVGDVAVGPKRDIEVDPHKDPLTSGIQLAERELVQEELPGALEGFVIRAWWTR